MLSPLVFQSVPGSIIKYFRLDDLNMVEMYFSQFRRLES